MSSWVFFARFSVSLLALNQLVKLVKALISLSFRLKKSLSAINTLLSSANNQSLKHSCKASVMSLIYDRNGSGPRTDPWGTPQFAFANLDFSPFSNVYWVQFVR